MAAALAGLAGAHALGYVIVAPVDAERHALLLRTGHGYFPRLALAAVLAAAVAAAAACALGFRSSGTDKRPRMCWGRAALVLALLQTGGFAILEPLERLLVDAPLHELTGPVGAIGVLLQVVVAAAAAALLQLVQKAAHAIRRARSDHPPAGRRASLPAPRRVERALPSRYASSFSLRGPPERLPLRLSL
ncbi:MAG: hypothetical protein M3133_05675 [Actinomycetota bacterium]|nr:hypothetical protein [Actinomycetota bacterium]